MSLQKDDYYRFGMEIMSQSASPKNEYLYNKKELQEETQEYDYGARFYDPVIARWTTVDPLAEQFRRWSPYNYVENDPVRLTDPDGMGPGYSDHGRMVMGRDGGLNKGKPNPFSPLLHLAASSVKASNVRAQYNAEAAKLQPGDKAARADLKARTREATPEPYKGMVEKSRPMAGERAKAADPNFTGNANKTNADVNFNMEFAGHAGTAVLVLGAYQSAVTITNSNEPVKETVTEGAGWAGAMYGGAEGATAWGPAGPWAAAAGGLAGSTMGYYFGKNGSDALLKIAPAMTGATKEYEESNKREGCSICNLAH